MKNRIIYGCLLLVMGLCSCNNWLDVNPKSEVKADKLFETEAGFKDALIGIYIGMTDARSYGADLSWKAIEFLSGQYQAASGTYGQLQRFNYENPSAQEFIEESWAKQYNLIANVNLLLESLDKKGDVLKPTTYNVIRGEALALRAMLHFDIIRLYAWGNMAQKNEYMDALCVPYVTSYTKIITGQKSYRETLALLHQDIKEALQYLVSDPMYPESVARPEGYDNLVSNIFFAGTSFKGRETRLSYPAALLLNARVYLWEGDKTNALECAEKVISACKKYVAEGRKSWATESGNVSVDKNSDSKDFVFKDELLFSLDVTKLSAYLEKAYSTTADEMVNYDRLIQKTDFVDDLFSLKSGEANSDLRYINQYEKAPDANGYLTIKIRKTGKMYYSDIIPLMRMSEAYLIAAECMVGKDQEKAVGYMNFLKEKRNIKPEYNLAKDMSDVDLMNAIVKEYRKEYVQEGQIFFCYKRLGLPTFPGIQSTDGKVTDEQYRLPYPKIEQDLGVRK